MSDHWEFFLCQMGEQTAFISYDHGIRKDIDKLQRPTLLKVRIAFRSPGPDGLSGNQEFDALTALEDELSAEMKKIGGVYVGRITVGGCRYFHIYLDAEEKDIVPIIEQLDHGSEYKIEFVLKSDPEKNGYWEDLFPTKQDWQVIQDLKVIEQLKAHGDDLQTVRRINHWIYFSDPAQRQAFGTWAKEDGFTVDRAFETDDAPVRFGLQIFHDGRPSHPEISQRTIMLLEKAEQCGGDYDGWETSVERKDAAKPN